MRHPASNNDREGSGPGNSSLFDVFIRLARRDDKRTEAEIQADVRQFILSAPFELDDSDVAIVNLEAQVANRRRIDVEVGATVIEVKRDLRKPKIRAEAIDQLAAYVAHRAGQTGVRYVGILTDGTEWICYGLLRDELEEISTLNLTVSPVDLEKLVFWLEGVLATAQSIAPTAQNIEARLGAGSSAYALDRKSLSVLYKDNENNPSVIMKRTLWSRLLASALGTQFEDTEALFIEHTLLVNSAEIIAHAVLGIPLDTVNPAALLNGNKFDESGIYGVVEADFFNWVMEVDGGEVFVRTLANRLARFEWTAVEQDVLKVLYESVIGADTRKRLGEYYTPDWLAHVIVSETVPDPLNSRVLDAACGSGTFLFHAVRNYITAGQKSGMDVRSLLDGVTRHVIGMDLHPVAVTLARVTYLLAIGKDLLTHPLRDTIQIPVYLGDSLQWQQQHVDLWTAGHLVIHADDNRELFSAELRFPDALLDNASDFDQLINELANRAARRKPKSPIPSLTSLFQRLGVATQHRAAIETTFKTMCRLHDEGRNHIWGYYVRNLARPYWMSRLENRVDVLIGNPPWLAYRHMTQEMQGAFRRMSEARGLWAGAKVATHQDLSGLFAVRAAELYLRVGGRFGLVLPNTALDRSHYEGFRSGNYAEASGQMGLTFDPPWDLRRIRPHFFPRGSGVVFGSRATDLGRPMPEETTIWNGSLKVQNLKWDEAAALLTRARGLLRRTGDTALSPYAPAFTQGATFTPRMAFVVEEQQAPTLGLPTGRVAVRSSRSIQEKRPWKHVPSLSGIIETEFLRPYYTGDNVFPFRICQPLLAVLPIGTREMMSDDQIGMHPGLHEWWTQSNDLWNENRASDKMSLRERLDYQATLSKQLPIPRLRVVYNRAGMHVVASKLKNRRAIVANGLYWASVKTEAEADYLTAVLNAPILTERVQPLMSYGKDERDIHKHIWELPIPEFNPEDKIHSRLVILGAEAETLAEGFSIVTTLHFAATRRHIRDHLATTPQGMEINELVRQLIS